MKKNTLYLFILLLITGLNTSCNYLDIVPTKQPRKRMPLPIPALHCDIYIPATDICLSQTWFSHVWTLPVTKRSARLPKVT